MFEWKEMKMPHLFSFGSATFNAKPQTLQDPVKNQAFYLN